MEKIYNIIATTNTAYANYLMVLLESLFESNPDMQFRIFVLYNEIVEEKQQQLNSFVSQNGSTIEFVYIDGEKYKNYPMSGRFSAETYYRLEIQSVLPTDIDRALFLDTDMVVTKSIKELYNTEFDDNFLVACGFTPDCSVRTDFNAGMLVMNIEKLRNEVDFSVYEAAAKELNWDFYADQGLLNYKFGKNGTKFVEKQKYNFTTPFYRKFRKELEEQNFSFDDIVIIHFAGPGIRPWQALITDEEFVQYKSANLLDIFANKGYIIDKLYVDLHQIWWKYAKNTPVYEELEIEMLKQKSDILTELMLAIAETNDYRIGNRIMHLVRKIKK